MREERESNDGGERNGQMTEQTAQRVARDQEPKGGEERVWIGRRSETQPERAVTRVNIYTV